MRVWRVPTILASAALATILLPAQGPPKPPGGTAGGPTTGTGTTGAPSAGRLPTMPGSGTTDPTTNPGLNSRGPFFYGRVAMPDGSAPPAGVIIERVCNGSTRPQAYTDGRGDFSFQVGQTQEMLPDATDDTSPTVNRGAQGAQKSNAILYGCDLRAKLAGYRSDAISLAGRHNLDDPNLGTIFLHPYAKVEGLTTSATSALAPKDAHKAFDRGLEAVKKSKLDDAQNNFLKATDLYPRYAAAWLELGRIYEQRGQNIEAREAYTRSLAADSRFVNPYERMYLLSFREKKWEDVAQITARVIRLNSYDFPGSFYYNAVANSQLGRLDTAEKSAREAVAVSATENPKVYYILGVILAKKQDFKGAGENLRIYLKSEAVTDRDTTAKLLAEIEKRSEAKLVLEPEPYP